MGRFWKSRFRWAVVAYGLVFAMLEVPLFIQWVQQVGGLSHVNDMYFSAIFKNLLFRMTFIDLTAVSLLILIWIVGDALRLRHLLLPLPVFMIMLFSPTLALLFYLFFRKDAPFFPPFEQESRR